MFNMIQIYKFVVRDSLFYLHLCAQCAIGLNPQIYNPMSEGMRGPPKSSKSLGRFWYWKHLKTMVLGIPHFNGFCWTVAIHYIDSRLLSYSHLGSFPAIQTIISMTTRGEVIIKFKQNSSKLILHFFPIETSISKLFHQVFPMIKPSKP